MLIAFTLSMPRSNTWNNRWSGEDKFYVRVRDIPEDKAKSILANDSYYYDFGDGWGALIEAEKVSSREAQKIRKNSAGFQGYEWMIDSIIEHGKIKKPERNCSGD